MPSPNFMMGTPGLLCCRKNKTSPTNVFLLELIRIVRICVRCVLVLIWRHEEGRSTGWSLDPTIHHQFVGNPMMEFRTKTWWKSSEDFTNGWKSRHFGSGMNRWIICWNRQNHDLWHILYWYRLNSFQFAWLEITIGISFCQGGYEQVILSCSKL